VLAQRLVEPKDAEFGSLPDPRMLGLSI